MGNLISSLDRPIPGLDRDSNWLASVNTQHRLINSSNFYDIELSIRQFFTTHILIFLPSYCDFWLALPVVAVMQWSETFSFCALECWVEQENKYIFLKGVW